jgi:hypothetical protein
MSRDDFRRREMISGKKQRKKPEGQQESCILLCAVYTIYYVIAFVLR